MLFASIHGVVFEDLNLNGIQDSGEIGLKGIKIQAVCSDKYNSTIYTGAKGYYKIKNYNANSYCRIIATPNSKLLENANYSSKSISPLVDIVPNNTQHNIALITKDNYCQDRPDVIIAGLPLYQEDNISKPDEHGALFKLPTPKYGEFIKDTDKRTILKLRKEIGAIWGLAYDKHHKDIYASSVLMRYVPLHNQQAGVIYKIDNNNTISPFINLGNKNVGVKSYIFPRDIRASKDALTKMLIGRAGFGDLDISNDSRYLYTVNMFKKELIKIKISDKTIKTFKIPNPYGDECNASSVRPWALKATNDGVFIGSVCEDRIEDGVGAYIQKFTEGKIVPLAKTNTLKYLRARGYNPKIKTSPAYQNHNWYDGEKSNLPQPILTDIEFTTRGDMVLGYSDRAAYMREREGSQGDVRKMCLNDDGTFTDESTNIAPTNCKSHEIIYRDNNESYFEFYTGDYYKGYLGEDGHPETAIGSLAVRRGDNYIYIGMVDGTKLFEAGSIGLLDNESGDKIAGEGLINSYSIKDKPYGEREIYGSKAGGIGDIEVMCDIAPIEIGDYIWMDTNKNGLQDPDEPPLKNIKVKLFKDYKLIGQSLSDERGHYYFGGVRNINLLDKNITIKSDTNYTIKIAKYDTFNQDSTIKDINMDKNDTIDSDAYTMGGYHIVDIHTTEDSNQSYDIGILPAYGCMSIKIFEDRDKNGIFSKGDNYAPSGIKLTIEDKFGHKKIYTTNKKGVVEIPKLLIGEKTVSVNLSSDKLPKSIKWSYSSIATNIDFDMSGCKEVLFSYHKGWFDSILDSVGL